MCMKRWICGTLAVLMLFAFTACGKEEAPEATETQTEEQVQTQPTEQEEARPEFKGLVLKAAPEVYVTLYTEFEEGTVIVPTETYTYGDAQYFCYSGVMGPCRYVAKGGGYYAVTKNLVVTQEDNEKETLIDVTPGKMAGTGWEPTAYTGYTSQLLEGPYSSDLSQWPEYAELMTSPWFTQGNPDHQITTQAQMEQYLNSLDDADDQMYIFSAGASGLYRHDIPMVVFTNTDLSSATNVDEAAAILGQDKPTVMYRSQMHGNEPAGGEAALVMIGWLDSTLGAELLEHINICVIPRQSPDGAQNYERTVLGGIDPNRDSLRLKTPEIIEFTRVCNLLEPELIIDGHEYNAQVSNKTMGSGELLVGAGFTNNNTDTFKNLALDLSNEAFAAVEAGGMDYRYYTNYVNSVNASVSRCYWSLLGTQFILLETRGIGCGLEMYNRRIVCHVIATEALLRYAAENAENLQTVVEQERQSIIEKGAYYRQETLVGLDYTAVEDPSLNHGGRKHDQITGTSTQTIMTPKVYTAAKRTRVAPTAYVIPADESYTESVLNLMDKHEIAYTFIPAGCRVRLQQYTGTVEEATLAPETTVTFPNGAYVFCRNQVGGQILSMLMEPDVDDLEETKGTIAQSGVIWATDNTFPIYRYIHDLNAEGFIDYQ